MKRHEFIIWSLKFLSDFFWIFLAFFWSRDIRLVTDLIPWISLPIKEIMTPDLLFFALTWSVVYVFIMLFHGLYVNELSNSKIKEYTSIIKYWFYWFILYSFLVYFWNWYLYEKDIPRLVLIFTLVIWTFFSLSWRVFLNFVQGYLLSVWRIEKTKLLLVFPSEKKDISYILEDIQSAWIYDVIWYISDQDNETTLAYKWNLDYWKELIRLGQVEEVLYAGSNFSIGEINDFIEFTKIYGVRYRYLTNNYDLSKNNTEISLLNKIILVEIKNTSLDLYSRILKRITDIFISFFALIALVPVFIVVAILIKKEDPSGPVFYKNRRVGQNWKEFNLYKFRYMKWEYCVKDSYWLSSEKDDALAFEKELIEKSSTREWPLYKIENDPRKTKIWAIIEKYSIDELPQFWNVLIWNMSVIWPRPHQPREVENYSETQKRVLTIKPGITWMAQVNGREDNSFEKEVRLDVFYIENWSFVLDLKIFFKTFVVTFFRGVK